ncbi:MAG: exosortase-associated EpsI family protein [Pirellulales bacterium]
MNQFLAMVIALSAITGVTIYEGLRFEFWSTTDPEELNHFAERLEAVPESFGDWSSEPAEADEEQLAAAQVHAHVSRDYVNGKTGAKVNVFLVCGKTHPMAIHSPDQCYAAVGFTQGDPSRKYVEVNGRTAELWSSRFSREENLEQQALDVVWAWAADDGVWQAPTSPRPHFSNRNALYKIYLITAPGADSDAESFLKDFLPVLDKQLFTPVKPKTETADETTS